jgi:hypothetical protein
MSLVYALLNTHVPKHSASRKRYHAAPRAHTYLVGAMTKPSLAVLVIAFERPSETRAVLEVLANFSSANVAVFQDGPRDSPEARERHRAVREVIREFRGDVIHECRALEKNAGCAFGVGEAIRWFFSNNNRGVVLEDDCLPTIEFLEFCAAGLSRHQNDQQIGSIGGQGYSRPANATPGTTVLSRYPQIWGWATWRDRLEGFQVVVPQWRTALKDSTQWRELGSLERRDWRRTFKSVATARPHTWDAQLVLHHWSRNQYALLPPVALVENIGFGALATHTKGNPPSWVQPLGSWRERRDAVSLLTSSQSEPSRNTQVDSWLSANVYSPSILSRMRRRLRVDE